VYEKIGVISDACRRELLRSLPPAKLAKESDRYGVSPKLDKLALLVDLPDDLDWAWLVMLPPNGLLHEHMDSEPERYQLRRHIVLATNDACESWNGGTKYHLDDLGIYEMTPGLAHKSLNGGETDRIHLVVFYG